MKTLKKDVSRQQDPREAILRFAQQAKDDPYWISPAYKDNSVVIGESVYENEEEKKQAEKKRKRK
jgi:hypothetical protein